MRERERERDMESTTVLILHPLLFSLSVSSSLTPSPRNWKTGFDSWASQSHTTTRCGSVPVSSTFGLSSFLFLSTSALTKRERERGRVVFVCRSCLTPVSLSPALAARGPLPRPSPPLTDRPRRERQRENWHLRPLRAKPMQSCVPCIPPT